MQRAESYDYLRRRRRQGKETAGLRIYSLNGPPRIPVTVPTRLMLQSKYQQTDALVPSLLPRYSPRHPVSAVKGVPFPECLRKVKEQAKGSKVASSLAHSSTFKGGVKLYTRFRAEGKRTRSSAVTLNPASEASLGERKRKLGPFHGAADLRAGTCISKKVETTGGSRAV